ncbi:MAG: ArsC family (seleno)protein [Proteobacteria bacterium]|nr:ArsC family (seleno)protein [Pseudomonadota bacterium]
MEANGLEPKEAIPASRKLGRDDATELASNATTVIVAKGKKVVSFSPKGNPGDDVIAAMLGPTGNLRAPTLRSGKTVVVGFSEDEYQKVLID